MSKEEIIDNIQEIFTNRYDINISNRWQEVQNYPLLGHKIGLSPSQLLYLFFDVENIFHIKIPESSIVNGDFHTLASIVDLVLKEC